MNDAKKFMITQDNTFCNSEFTVFDEMNQKTLYSVTELYNEVEFVNYGQNAGFNSR